MFPPIRFLVGPNFMWKKKKNIMLIQHNGFKVILHFHSQICEISFSYVCKICANKVKTFANKFFPV